VKFIEGAAWNGVVCCRPMQIGDHRLGLPFAIIAAPGNLQMRRAQSYAAVFARPRPLRTRLFRVWRTA
jgi:hypothetical protein